MEEDDDDDQRRPLDAQPAAGASGVEMIFFMGSILAANSSRTMNTTQAKIVILSGAKDLTIR